MIFSFGLLFSQSEKQIKEALNTYGISETQARSIARSKGLSNTELKNEAVKAGGIEKPDIIELRNKKTNNRINSLGREKEKESFKNKKEIKKDIKKEIETDIEKDISVNNSNTKPSIKGSGHYFGYDIFDNDPLSFQASNFGVIDPGYNIGPGDEIIILLWGETQFRESFKVDKEGYVFIPEIGQVFVNGLTLKTLETKLFKILSKAYSSLKSSIGTATSFLDVSLGDLRPLRIMVLGEVSQPGAYTVNPTTTLFSSLYYFNGPTKSGSLRDIQLIRNGRLVTSIDFYNYLLSGDTSGDVRLQIDDIIFIPPRGKTVTLLGQVKREGVYELNEEEALLDLIKISGGLKKTAFIDRAQIDRIIPFSERTDELKNRLIEDFSLKDILNNKDSLSLRDEDKIQVFSIKDQHHNVVFIGGSSVTRPGRYELIEDMLVSDLIDISGGLSRNTYYDKAYVKRLSQEDFKDELLSINLQEALKNNPEHNLKLKLMDRLQIFSYDEMIPEYSIEILGHVKKPGKYQLLKNMTIYDVLFIYGGFIDKEWREKTFGSRVELTRLDTNNNSRKTFIFDLDSILKKFGSDQYFKLMPGDKIIIYPHAILDPLRSVIINGGVKNPGQYTLRTNMILKDLILEAGGLSEDIHRFRVEISRKDPLSKEKNNSSNIINFDIDESLLDNLSGENLSNDIKISNLNFPLEPYDLIQIRLDPYFQKQKIVTLQGEVLYPGIYALKTSDETVYDIVKRGGGLLKSAYPEASLFTRNGENISISFSEILKNRKSNQNINIQHKDLITFNKKTDLVKVLGEVNNPNRHIYLPGKRFNYYVKISGGYSQNYDKNSRWITNPNGESRKVGRFLSNPKIIDGTIINISRKEDEEPLDKTELAKELTSIISNFAQVIFMYLLSSPN